MNAQGTIEWRQARVGRVTASRVGVILGLSPYKTRKSLLKDMVAEAMGDIHEVNAPPLVWGRDNEAKARQEYQALYCSEDVVEVGLLVHPDYEWLAASPDGLVGERGMVEIKCPYAIRNDACPEFKSAKDQPTYWHQIQCQLFVADRDWCDLFQWTPNDHEMERVHRDPDWFASVNDKIIEFLSEYEGVLQSGPNNLTCSHAWMSAVADYRKASAAEDEAKAAKSKARDKLIALAGDCDEVADDCIRIQRIDSVGTVSYSKMAKALAGDDFDDICEQYRGNPSTSHRITIIGDKS